MKAIDIKGLTKTYGQRTVVNQLNLTIEEGEFFALLGSNGAGKTTTIKMLSCLLAPSSGQATILGYDLGQAEEKIKSQINLSPQETAVAPKLSVKENLLLIARLYGYSKKEAEEKAAEMMTTFDLTERQNDRAKALSGGIQRKLSIAMALISQPKILFLDEPTLGLDVRARHELWKTIEALKGKTTLILTTHYLEEAEALADRICIMNKGKIQILGSAQEIIKASGQKNFEEAFLAYTEEGELA
ncbi:ABC transporter ATP-binding protein [Streptococcus oricebi]|uniref:ABC transporter ATP-binding protein n=1 Tax=Streptococcus oricebi TaxID=1547447 RepID=A0ABS5B635_9STRE|nr:ABC transporter ATP-binding protein [Streptococcus oricebi]MBP2624293.1 ABC transporter ATP-binding protein [Streptococcus oricebi]